MATEERIVEIKTRRVTLTRKEAVDIIGLLSAQLANEPLIGNSSGSSPDIRITSNDGHTTWMAFILDTEPGRGCWEYIDTEAKQVVVVLNRRQVAYTIISLVTDLGALPQGEKTIPIFTKDRTKFLHYLIFKVAGVQ